MRRLAPAVIIGMLLESRIPISKIRLMKMLFLARYETSITAAGAFYDFLPYKYGPYSFAADRDLWESAHDGLIVGDRLYIPAWRREEASNSYEALPEPICGQVHELVNRYRSWSDQRLIDHVYLCYPAYTVLSERHGAPSARHIASPAVYTLGYQGSSIDAFLRALIACGLERLVDVRNNPISRRYGYSKVTLSRLSRKIGVEYIHIPELGVPSSERQALSNAASYLSLFDRYELETLSQQVNALERTAALAQEKASALLCFEADVTQCHRERLANRVAAITGLPVRHLEVAHD